MVGGVATLIEKVTHTLERFDVHALLDIELPLILGCVLEVRVHANAFEELVLARLLLKGLPGGGVIIFVLFQRPSAQCTIIDVLIELVNCPLNLHHLFKLTLIFWYEEASISSRHNMKKTFLENGVIEDWTYRILASKSA